VTSNEGGSVCAAYDRRIVNNSTALAIKESGSDGQSAVDFVDNKLLQLKSCIVTRNISTR